MRVRTEHSGVPKSIVSASMAQRTESVCACEYSYMVEYIRDRAPSVRVERERAYLRWHREQRVPSKGENERLAPKRPNVTIG